MTLLESTKVALGTPAPDFSLPGVDDKEHSLKNYKGSKALVIIFMCNHCPYVQAQWSRMVDLQNKYKDQGVQFIGINANYNPDYPEDSFEKMKEYSQEYGMNFPYLMDESQDVARAYKAQCTPDIFVYDSNQKLAYHGRIDDSWKNGNAVSTHELDDALALLVLGDQPKEEQIPSLGCSIKWRE